MKAIITIEFEGMEGEVTIAGDIKAELIRLNGASHFNGVSIQVEGDGTGKVAMLEGASIDNDEIVGTFIHEGK